MLVAALMAAQPNSRPSARQRERNAELLSEVLEADEHRLRWQATKHAELPDDVDDALQSAYALFLDRYNGLGEPLAWLYTTVKREAWAMRRRDHGGASAASNAWRMTKALSGICRRRCRATGPPRRSASAGMSSCWSAVKLWRL